MEPEHFSSFTTRRKFIRQAACAALGTAALTNTIRDLRFISAAMAQDSTQRPAGAEAFRRLAQRKGA